MVRTEVIEWLKSIKEKYIHCGDDFYDHQRRTAIDYAVGFLEGQKPMTKADRIRAMSDEELADFLGMLCHGIEDCADCPLYHDGCPGSGEFYEWIKWLQQPAEGGVNT